MKYISNIIGILHNILSKLGNFIMKHRWLRGWTIVFIFIILYAILLGIIVFIPKIYYNQCIDRLINKDFDKFDLLYKCFLNRYYKGGASEARLYMEKYSSYSDDNLKKLLLNYKIQI